MVGATIRSSGERIVDDDTKLEFVQGAYNNGAVLEYKEIETAGIHPGEGVDNATGAGGEDNIVLMLDKSLNAYGILEIDGCEYVVFDKGGIEHLANCKNEHIKH